MLSAYFLVLVLKLIPLATACVVMLASCGKSAKVDVEENMKSEFGITLSNQTLGPKEFKAQCEAQGGVLNPDGTLCATATQPLLAQDGPKLLEGESFIMKMDSVELGEITGGMALKTFGSVTDDAVALYLDDEKVAGVPTNGPVLLNRKGKLRLYVQPGEQKNVRIFLYTCRNNQMHITACKF